MYHFIKHFQTVGKHRRVVRHYCFKLGLYWQGLTHDLTKYSLAEAIPGAKYYQGFCSPHEQERKINGFSKAWMHHKGRNKHHFEYWTDFSTKTGKYESTPMPMKYVKEMLCDRIGACKVYKGNDYYDGSAYDYFAHSKAKYNMHPETSKIMEDWLFMLKEKGEEETFAYIRKNFPNKPKKN